MIFVWGLLVFSGLALASSADRNRSARFVSGALLAAVFATFCVLAGLDNAKSELVDCRSVVDPNTGGDVLSCAKDHWLPTGLARAINRF